MNPYNAGNQMPLQGGQPNYHESNSSPQVNYGMGHQGAPQHVPPGYYYSQYRQYGAIANMQPSFAPHMPTGVPNHHHHHHLPYGGQNQGTAPPGGVQVAQPANAQLRSQQLHGPEDEWTPPPEDRAKLDHWFQELDSDHSGCVGGAKAVAFLKNSNLQKDTLRSIWALVDTAGVGKVDRHQFYKILRLVSISCSPIYAGSRPTLEKYYETAKKVIALPDLPFPEEHTAANASCLTPAAPASVSSGATPTSASLQPATAHPIVHGNNQIVGSVPSAAVAVHEWVPSAEDKATLDRWFNDLDSNHSGIIGGAAAVSFLKNSRLSKETLRAIWAVVDSAGAGHVDRPQFYKIMRFVSIIASSPTHANCPQPTNELYQATLAQPIPLVKMVLAGGADAHHATSSVHNITHTTEIPVQTHHQAHHHVSTTPAAATASNILPLATAPQPPTVPPPLPPSIPTPLSLSPATTTHATIHEWVPSAEDKATLDHWFNDLDSNHSGIIGGAAAVSFLKNSHLSKETLRAIWAVVDSAGAGHVDRPQFYKIMRFVSIIASSPTHANCPQPSMDLYRATINVNVPLLDMGPTNGPPVTRAPATSGNPNAMTGIPNQASVPALPLPSNNHDPIIRGSDFNDLNHLHHHHQHHTDGLPTASSTSSTTFGQHNDVLHSYAPTTTTAAATATAVLTSHRSSVGESVPAPALSSSSSTTSTKTNISTSTSVLSSSSPDTSSSFSKGEVVEYRRPPLTASDHGGDPSSSGKKQEEGEVELVTVIGVHHDDFPHIYYTIRFLSDDREKQTDANRLTRMATEDAGGFDNDDMMGEFAAAPAIVPDIPAIVPDPTTAFNNHHSNLLGAPSVGTNNILVSGSGHYHGYKQATQSPPQAAARVAPTVAEVAAAAAAAVAPPSSHHPTAATTSSMSMMNDRMSILDDLIGSDLQFNAIEDWEDFAEPATAPPIPICFPATAPPVPICFPATTAPGIFAVTATPPVPNSFASSLPLPVPHSLDESFGSFTEADADVETHDHPLNESFGSFADAHPVTNATVTSTTVTSSAATAITHPAGSSSLSLYVENNKIAAVAAALGEVLDDDDFGDFADSSSHHHNDDIDQAGHATPTTVPLPPDDIHDPFAHIEPPAPSISLPPMVPPPQLPQVPPQLPQPMAQTQTQLPTSSQHLNGDYPIAAAVPAYFTPATAVDVPRIPSSETLKQSNSTSSSSSSSSFAPITSTQTQPPTNTTTSLLLVAPTVSTTHAPHTSSSSSSDAFGFGDDDQFSDFSAAATPSTPLHSISAAVASLPPVSPEFSAFETAAGVLPILTSPLSSTSTRIDLFAMSPPPPDLDIDIDSGLSTAHPLWQQQEQGQSQMPSSVSLSTQLEQLAAVLEGKRLFEEAHLSLQQADTRRTLEGLNQEKRLAVEADDLDKAVSIKLRIADCNRAMRSEVEERVWVSAAVSGSQGESLDGLVELVEQLQPSLGAIYRRRFVDQAPAANDTLKHRIKFSLLAKRCIRLGTAISTTHTSIPDSWFKVLSHVSQALQHASKTVLAFEQLSVQDRQAVLSTEKMITFLRGARAVAETGVWVATSCLEAMVHDDLAAKVVRQCAEFCTHAAAVTSSQDYSLPSVKELTTRAVAMSLEPSIIYCNLTLRPVGVTTATTTSGSTDGRDVNKFVMGDRAVKYVRHKSVPYLQSAINLWLHSISPEAPQSDGTF